MTDHAKLPASIHLGATVAGRYRIDRVLNSGGMGVVAVATQLVTEQPVAIKFMLVNSRFDATSLSAKRFAREAKTAAMLTNEHATRVLDVAALDSGEPYIVMEFLNGADLQHTVEERGRLPVAEAVEYMLQAFEALAEAHLVGIVHRDVKPSNLFLTRSRDSRPLIKVLDFGLSKITRSRAKTESLTGESTILGSPAFMSPEQIHDSKDVDGRADIWGIGATLYFLLEDRLPFNATDIGKVVNRVMAHPPHPFERKDLPDGLQAAILRCLEKRPDDRFQSVHELARAIAPFGSAEAPRHLEVIKRMHAQMIDTRPGHKPSSSAMRAASTVVKSSAPVQRSAPEGIDSLAAATPDRRVRRAAGGALMLLTAFVVALGLTRLGRAPAPPAGPSPPTPTEVSPVAATQAPQAAPPSPPAESSTQNVAPAAAATSKTPSARATAPSQTRRRPARTESPAAVTAPVTHPDPMAYP